LSIFFFELETLIVVFVLTDMCNSNHNWK